MGDSDDVKCLCFCVVCCRFVVLLLLSSRSSNYDIAMGFDGGDVLFDDVDVISCVL